MTYDEAIEKVAKLLRLSKSANEHEAALACARAQEIMDRYKIDALSVDEKNGDGKPDEPIKDFKDDPLDPGSILATWKWRLFVTVGKQNRCKGYRSAKGGIAIVGRPSDAQTVRYIHGWLCREIERISGEACRGNGRTYANNFRIGMVETVCKRLEAMHKETVAKVQEEAQAKVAYGETMALVRVNNALAKMEAQLSSVQDWMDTNLRLRSGSARRITYNGSAREAGRAAGHNVRIQPTRGHISNAA